jgi:disulfide bond formation protein DsbB
MLKVNLHKIFVSMTILVASWGIGNVLYWEVYLGYPACNICLWHRYLYISMSILAIILIFYSKKIIRWLILIILGIEFVISLKIFISLCDDSVCKIISTADYVNFSLITLTLITLSIIEILIWKKLNKTKLTKN